MKTSSTIKNTIIGSLAFVSAAIIMALIFTVPLWLAWNYEMVKFGLRPLALVDALALSFICSLLFKGSSTINPTLLK